MVRDRVLSERHFGQPTLLRRLLRIPLIWALVLAAPALVPCLWYPFAAAAAHYNYVAASGENEPLTLELLHLHLYDRLVQDRRKIILPEASGDSPLPTYGLVLSNDTLDRLSRLLPPKDGPENYVSAHVTRKSQIYEVDVRYRGSKHWHWIGPQKSWKVRTKNGRPFSGVDTFNFLNTPDPMPFSEQMILDIARDKGLLTPDYYPFRLLLNNAYLGVYYFETQPAEDLLRLSRRAPGSIFSGNGAPFDPKTGISTLWESPGSWKKVAAWKTELLGDDSELRALIDAVHTASPQRFAQFASRHLDLEKFATFDALDVVFGNNQHDYHQNHKLYFDPYRGRFEPIATDFRDIGHETELNRTDNPLLLRLKQLPRYLSLRNRRVYELVRGPCSPESMRSRTDHLISTLEQDQIRDPFWDAYELLPDMGNYYRHLLRPMDRQIQASAAEARLREHGERVRYLRGLLEVDEIDASIAPDQQVPGPASSEDAAAVDIIVGGHSGYRLLETFATWPADCRPEAWDLRMDSNLDDALDGSVDRALGSAGGADAPATSDIALFPGVRFVPKEPHPLRGRVRAEPDARRFRFFVDASGCEPVSVRFRLKGLVTSDTVDVVANGASAERKVDSTPSCIADGPATAPGSRSPHPWCEDEERTERTVRLGPGVVEVAETRVFGPEETVLFAPGTTVRLGDQASMIFHGRVEANGSPGSPIRFEPLGSRFGGIALQGVHTQGSRLSHVELRSGSHPVHGLTAFPGTLNIHDTSDIQVSGLFVSDSIGHSDGIHAAYVHGMVVRQSRIESVTGNAVHADFVTAGFDDLTVVRAGGDCIDLVGSDVEVSASRLLACGASAVSANERSSARVSHTVAARGDIGLTVTRGSTVTVEGVLLYNNRVGAHVQRMSEGSGLKNEIKAEVLYSVGNGRTWSISSRKLKTVGRIADQIREDDLEPLRKRVLGLEDWRGLDAALDRLGHAEAP